MENDKDKEKDNRNVITLEELNLEAPKSEEKEAGEKEEKEEKKEKYLEDEDLKALIYAERSALPSVLLDEIYDSLKGRRVTRSQLKRIISRVKDNLDTESKLEKIDDLYKKLEALEKLLKNFAPSKQLKKEEEADEIILGAANGLEKEPDTKAEPKEVGKALGNVEDFEDVEVEIAGETVEPETGYHFESSQDYEALKEVSGGNGGIKMSMVKDELLKKEGDGKKTNGIKLTELPPDSKRIIFLLKWIEYLVERVGYEELENALDYYVDIGWISEDVLFSILRYARGIKLYHEKSDWRPVGYLNVQDHIMSLMFIEALRTGRFSREKIMEVEREVFRMKREAIELNGI